MMTHESPEFITHGSPEACLIKTTILKRLQQMKATSENPDWDFKIWEDDATDKTYADPRFGYKKFKGKYRFMLEYGIFFKENKPVMERPCNVFMCEEIQFVDADSDRDTQIEALKSILYALILSGLVSKEEFWS